MRLTVGLGKGGSGKSLSSLYLAAGLAQRGGRVLLVDADPANATVSDWMRHAEDWPRDQVKVEPWASRALGASIEAEAAHYDHVIVDTGPSHPEILTAALEATGELLVPIGPSAVELRQLGATLTIAAQVEATRPVSVRCLLTKLRTGTRSSTDARTYLERLDVPVLAAQVALREAYPASWGTWPHDLLDYGPVLDELLAELEPAVVPA